MKIKCTKCEYIQETSVSFFIKLIGGSLPVGGFWAWVTFFFAGTGLALPICIAMVAGGTALLVYKQEIVNFIIKQKYKCPNCGNTSWVSITEEEARNIRKRKEKEEQRIREENLIKEREEQRIRAENLRKEKEEQRIRAINLRKEKEEQRIREENLKKKKDLFSTEGNNFFIKELEADLDTHMDNLEVPIFRKMKFVNPLDDWEDELIYAENRVTNIYLTKETAAIRWRYNEYLGRIPDPIVESNQQGFYRIYYWFDPDARGYLESSVGSEHPQFGKLAIMGNFQPEKDNLLHVQYMSFNRRGYFEDAKKELMQEQNNTQDTNKKKIDIDDFMLIKEIIPIGIQAKAIYANGNYIINGPAGVGKSTTAVQKIKILTTQKNVNEKQIIIVVKNKQTIKIFKNLLESINIYGVGIITYDDFVKENKVNLPLMEKDLLLDSYKQASNIFDSFTYVMKEYSKSSMILDKKTFLEKEEYLFRLIENTSFFMDIDSLKKQSNTLKNERNALENNLMEISRKYDNKRIDKKDFLLKQQKEEKIFEFKNKLISKIGSMEDNKNFAKEIENLDFLYTSKETIENIFDRLDINESIKKKNHEEIQSIFKIKDLNITYREKYNGYLESLNKKEKDEKKNEEKKAKIKSKEKSIFEAIKNVKSKFFSLEFLEQLLSVNSNTIRYINKESRISSLPEYDTVIIDEAQDMSCESIEIIRLYAKNTILTGDELQSENPDGLKKWSNLINKKYFMSDDELQIFNLVYNFRQTYELANFSHNFRLLLLNRPPEDIRGEYYENQKNFNKPSIKYIDSDQSFIDIIKDKLEYIASSFIQKFPLVIFCEDYQNLEYCKTLLNASSISYEIDKGYKHHKSNSDVLLIIRNEIAGREFPVVVANLVEHIDNNEIYLMITRARYDLTLVVQNGEEKNKNIIKLRENGILV